MANCEATVKVIADRCDKDSKHLQQLSEQYKNAAEKSENCSADLAKCNEEKTELKSGNKNYEAKVYKLEQKSKDAKEATEKNEKLIIQAKEGRSA